MSFTWQKLSEATALFSPSWVEKRFGPFPDGDVTEKQYNNIRAAWSLDHASRLPAFALAVERLSPKVEKEKR